MKAITQGFSLIELLVAVTVLGVIAAIAIPSFGDMLDSSRRATIASEMASDFSLARTEAARRGKRVTVCVSSDGTTCSSSETDWKSGWIVFSDVAADGVLASADGDELLKRREALPGNFSFVSSGFSAGGRVQFRPSGAADSGGALLLCKPGKPGDNGRRVSLSFSGAVTKTSGVTCS